MSTVLYDLDECLFVGDIVKSAISLLIEEETTFDLEYNGSMAIDYKFSNFPKVLKDKIYELYNDSFYACYNKQVLPGIYTYLYYLTKVKNHTIGYLTSRPACISGCTIEKVAKDFPGIFWKYQLFSNLEDNFSIHSSSSKKSLLLSVKPDYFFDDNSKYCIEAKEIGIKNVYLITNSHTGWNHQFIYSEQHKKYGIKLVKNIMEVGVDL